MFEFYEPVNNPHALTGTVGGAIDLTNPLSGVIGELFFHVTAAPSGVDTTFHQYRKVFIKNTYSKASTNTRVWLDVVEHQEQISIYTASGLNDTATSPTGQPIGVTGWVSPNNYSAGLQIGTLTSNGYTGIWIRESLSGITNPDPYSSFRLIAGGIIS